MTEEWGPWVYGWDGVVVGMDVQCQVRCQESDNVVTHECRIVGEDDDCFKIDPDLPEDGEWALIKHRKKRPPALQRLAMMVQNLPAHKPQYEDA